VSAPSGYRGVLVAFLRISLSPHEVPGKSDALDVHLDLLGKQLLDTSGSFLALLYLYLHPTVLGHHMFDMITR